MSLFGQRKEAAGAGELKKIEDHERQGNRPEDNAKAGIGLKR